MQDVSNNPMAQAIRDFMDGSGFDENPYPKESSEYIKYQEEMHRLWNRELQDIRSAMSQGAR